MPSPSDGGGIAPRRQVLAPTVAGPAPGYAAGQLGVGIALVVVVFVLGACAQLAAVAGWSLRVDRYIADHGRTPALTAAASWLTTIATPETVGVGAIVLLPVVLVLSGRRSAAVRVLCIIAGALALALLAKALIGEHRPPSALWAAAADSGASYPSGHVTVAAAIAVSLVVVAQTWAWRWAAIVAGALYVIGVAVSRVYLANHYPLDVIGSVLCALAAGFIVTGLVAFGPIHANLARLDSSRRRRHPAD